MLLNILLCRRLHCFLFCLLFVCGDIKSSEPLEQDSPLLFSCSSVGNAQSCERSPFTPRYSQRSQGSLFSCSSVGNAQSCKRSPFTPRYSQRSKISLFSGNSCVSADDTCKSSSWTPHNTKRLFYPRNRMLQISVEQGSVESVVVDKEHKGLRSKRKLVLSSSDEGGSESLVREKENRRPCNPYQQESRGWKRTHFTFSDPKDSEEDSLVCASESPAEKKRCIDGCMLMLRPKSDAAAKSLIRDDKSFSQIIDQDFECSLNEEDWLGWSDKMRKCTHKGAKTKERTFVFAEPKTPKREPSIGEWAHARRMHQTNMVLDRLGSTRDSQFMLRVDCQITPPSMYKRKKRGCPALFKRCNALGEITPRSRKKAPKGKPSPLQKGRRLFDE